MSNADEDTLSFLRLVITRTRRPAEYSLQLARFIAYGADGAELQLVDARNPRGNNHGGGVPANTLDGSAHTKWFDANKGALECRIASGPTKVTGYALVTANDEPNRDPVRWVLEGRLGEDGEWRVIDDKDTGEDQPVPRARHAEFEVTAMVRGAVAAEEARLTRAEKENAADKLSKVDGDTLRAMRAAIPALEKRWPEGESPRSWKGVTWGADRVQELDLNGSKLEVLAPEIGQLQALTKLLLQDCKLVELPPEIGQLRALTTLRLQGCRSLVALPPEFGQLLALNTIDALFCDQLILAPGAEQVLQPGQTTVAAYARLLIVEPHKDTPDQLHAFLLANRLAVPAFFKFILTDATHAAWLGEAVEATPSLAGLTDADGRRVIDVAHSVCKQAMQAALFLLGRYEADDGSLLHRSTTAAVAAATDHGDPEAKPVPRVALKAMREVEQVCAELKGRVGLDPKYVIAVKAVYADEKAVEAGAWDTVVTAAAGLEGVVLERVPGLSSSIQAHLFPSKQNTDQDSAPAAPGAARKLTRRLSVRTLDASSEYKLLIVLELADRTLKHTIDHEHIAGEDWPAIRHIATDLAWALDHVHAKGGIHADFKPLNAVGDRDTWKIIDFDVFCKVGERFGSKVPSSGYCPPEMAKVLLAATNKATGKVDTSLLKEYIASKEYDLWSFGVVLYQLCFGTPLWKTNTDDNVELEDLLTLAAVPDTQLRRALDKALNKGEIRSASDDLTAATALLRKLLEPDEKKRLDHFYNAESPTCAACSRSPSFS